MPEVMQNATGKADETRVEVVATAICHLCAGRNPTTVGEGPVTLVGRDALVMALGRAAEKLQPTKALDQMFAALHDHIEPTLAALREFDKDNS